MKHIRSRIHQFISPGLMKALKDISQNVKISDNNTKVRLIREALQAHELVYNELGPGTNRFAILVDGYVFKIAMDEWGVLDNDNEFAMTEVLQPFVTTVYETNGLISVSEYVTLIGKDEFMEKKSEIIKILSILSEGFLLGDVGYAPKNFANWGYRTDGSLVILDFAYIYNIVGDEIMCQKDGNILQYDENFNYLRCPYCRSKYDTIKIRKLIPKEHEIAEINFAKKAAYALKTETIEVEEEEDKEVIDVKEKEKEEIEMKQEFTEEEQQEGFMHIFDAFSNPKQYNAKKVEAKEEIIEEEPEEDDELSNISQVVQQSAKNNFGVDNDDEEETDYNDPLASVIGAFGSNNDFRKPYEEPEEVIEEEEVKGPRLTPLEIAMASAGFDPDEEDGKEIEIEQRDPIKDDGVEENPEDYENPGQVTYVLEEVQPKVEVKPEPEVVEEPVKEKAEVVKHLIEEIQSEVKTNPFAATVPEAYEGDTDEESVEEETTEEVLTEEEAMEIEGDNAGEEIAPMVKVPQHEQMEGEDLGHEVYGDMADSIVYPDDDEDEENEEQEESKSHGIKRIGEAVVEAAEELTATTNVPEEEEDLMAVVSQIHNVNPTLEEDEDEQDKYDKLAESHLGRDPYDY